MNWRAPRRKTIGVSPTWRKRDNAAPAHPSALASCVALPPPSLGSCAPLHKGILPKAAPGHPWPPLHKGILPKAAPAHPCAPLHKGILPKILALPTGIGVRKNPGPVAD